MRCRPPRAAAPSAWTCARSASCARRSRASPASPTSPSPCRGSAAARSRCSATEDQRRAYLPAVADGRKIAAFALSEREAGSDVAAIATTAEPDGAGFVLNGAKTWISNGGIADFYVVFARTGEAPGAKGLSAFIVDAETPGLEIAERIRADRAAPARDAALRGLPRAARRGCSASPARASRSRWRRSTCSARPSAPRRSGSRAGRSTRRSRARPAGSCSAGRSPSCR